LPILLKVFFLGRLFLGRRIFALYRLLAER
jgi:hypothetical protein